MDRHTYIYLLVSKSHNKIYIGSTNLPKARLINHKSVGTMGNTFADSDNVEMEIIDTVTESKRMEWEAYYVALFKRWGFDLVNQKDVAQVGNPFFKKKNTKKLSRQELVWISQIKEHGDPVVISNKTGIRYNDVSFAIKRGRMTDDLYKIIISFYKKRQKEINKNKVLWP